MFLGYKLHMQPLVQGMWTRPSTIKFRMINFSVNAIGVGSNSKQTNKQIYLILSHINLIQLSKCLGSRFPKSPNQRGQFQSQHNCWVQCCRRLDMQFKLFHSFWISPQSNIVVKIFLIFFFTKCTEMLKMICKVFSLPEMKVFPVGGNQGIFRWMTRKLSVGLGKEREKSNSSNQAGSLALLVLECQQAFSDFLL